jgi:recombinational DNA repair protein RecR
MESKTKELVDILVEHHITICQLCVRLNPQHEDCYSCGDMERTQEIILEHTGEKWKEIKDDLYNKN